ncbi:hypothetical protein Tco_1240318 [Tanacetum coccineum]
MTSLPSPKPAISCFDDLDFFKDFKNEFLAIVYNDALTSKSDLLTELILNPQHVDDNDLKNETSLSEYDEEEQNVLYFDDLFPFNVIYLNDLKLDDDNDDNEINIIQSLGGYQGLEYSDADVADFQERLERIYSREIHKVQVMDFQGMSELIRDGLFTRMVMERRDDTGVVVFASRAWVRLFDTRGPLVRELILEFLSMLRFGEVLLDLDTPGTILFQLGPPPSYTLIRDPVLRLCHRMMACSIAGRIRYLRRFATGRKSMAHISGGQFIARLTEHFGLLTTEILRGLRVIAPKLLIIDMGELVRLQICMEVDDTWAWVAMGPERQPDVAAGAPGVAQDAPIVDEGG